METKDPVYEERIAEQKKQMAEERKKLVNVPSSKKSEPRDKPARSDPKYEKKPRQCRFGDKCHNEDCKFFPCIYKNADKQEKQDPSYSDPQGNYGAAVPK